MLSIVHEIKGFFKNLFEPCDINHTESQIFGMSLIANVNLYRII